MGRQVKCTSSYDSASSTWPIGEHRKCAKIFLGILPLIYWSLKYLQYKCDITKEKGGWQEVTIGENIMNTGHLGFFLKSEGYTVHTKASSSQLDINKKGFEVKTLLDVFVDTHLKGLYDCACKHFINQRSIPQPLAQRLSTGSGSAASTQSAEPKAPSTIREMLYWLGGLPFCGCYDQLESYIQQRCEDCGLPGYYDQLSLLNCYCSPFCIVILCDIQGKSYDWYEFYFSCECSYYYPSDPQECFDMLCCYVRHIYFVMNFLRIQCDIMSTHGGWKFCQFGKDVDAVNGSGTQGTAGTVDHKKGSNGKDEGCKCHDNQNLQAFLTDKSPFEFRPSKDSEAIKIGFKKEQLSKTEKKGADLYMTLFRISAAGCPLNLLCQYLSCISSCPPCTLGEIVDFFCSLPQRWDKVKDADGKVTLESAIKQDIEDEPGWYNPVALLDAFKAVSGNSGHKDKSGQVTHVDDLQSIMTCAEKDDTCGKYLYPLIWKIYWSYSIKCSSTYPSWVYNLAFELYSQLRALEEEFRNCPCCITTSNTKSSTSGCPNIAECTSGHPLFYKYGFTFMSPLSLSGKKNNGQEEEESKRKGKRTCSQFLAQLGKVLGKDAPLAKYIAECERFLWSIREPFAIALLAAWATVVLYWTYVHLLRLDLFHLRSHLIPALGNVVCHKPRTLSDFKWGEAASLRTKNRSRSMLILRLLVPIR